MGHANARTGQLGPAARAALRDRLNDPSPVVRIELASALAALAQALNHPVPEVVLHAAHADEPLGDLPMFIRFSLQAALDAPWAKDADPIQPPMQR